MRDDHLLALFGYSTDKFVHFQTTEHNSTNYSSIIRKSNWLFWGEII